MQWWSPGAASAAAVTVSVKLAVSPLVTVTPAGARLRHGVVRGVPDDAAGGVRDLGRLSGVAVRGSVQPGPACRPVTDVHRDHADVRRQQRGDGLGHGVSVARVVRRRVAEPGDDLRVAGPEVHRWPARTALVTSPAFVFALSIAGPMLPVVSASRTRSGFAGMADVVTFLAIVVLYPGSNVASTVDGSTPAGAARAAVSGRSRAPAVRTPKTVRSVPSLLRWCAVESGTFGHVSNAGRPGHRRTGPHHRNG